MKYTKIITIVSIWLSSIISYAQTNSIVIEEGFVKNNGARIYYKAIGTGEPIIVVHGGPGLNQSYFFPHLNELAKKHKLIFYDQRGCGKSTDSLNAETITMSNYLTDIDAIRVKFNLSQVTIMAHSFGGVFATSYTINYPNYVKRLILVNSVPLSKEFDKEIGRLNKIKQTKSDSIERANILASNDFKNGDSKAYENLFKVVFKSSFYNRNFSDSLKLDLEQKFSENRKKLFNLLKDLNDFNFYPDLPKIVCPVFIIYGKDDAIPLRAYEQMTMGLKSFKLIGIANCGHYPFIEQKKKFNELLKTLLK